MDMKNESGFQTKPRKKIKFDPRNLIILAMGISLAVLGVKTSELDKALTEDEEYISAEASRVFEYYGEKDVINLADPTYGDTWLAALSDVPRHEMDFDNVRLENGFKNYYIDGVKANTTGIDVSYHQGDIDWETLSRQGIDFAFIKATEGSGYADTYFRNNYKNAADTDIRIGAYHFFSFDSPGKTQAENFIRTVPVTDDMLPPVIDLEYYGIVLSKDTKNYIYRYWYENDAGDDQPVVLNVTFDTDNKYLYYSSTLIYPEYL